jgi:myosin heavy subunit
VLQKLERLQNELSGLIAANATLTALCEDDKKLRHATSEQVTSLQQMLTERDKTASEMRTQLQATNEELRTSHSKGERERLSLTEQVASLQQQLTEQEKTVSDVQAQLQAANEDLRATQSSREEERLALGEQLGFLQQQLVERNQTVSDVQAQLQAANEELHAVLLEKESAEQRAARAEQELNAGCAQSSFPASAVVVGPAHLAADLSRAALMSECDTIITQFAHVPLLMDALQQRDELQAQLEAAELAGDDYELLGKRGVQLETLKVKVAQLPLCEESHATLADRHQALVRKVTAACEALARTKAYAELGFLGAKLNELRGLDVSALPPPWANDPVLLPAPEG